MRYDLYMKNILRAPEGAEDGASPTWVDNPAPTPDDATANENLPPGAKPSDNPMEDYEKAVGESLWGEGGKPPARKVVKIGDDEVPVFDEEKPDGEAAPDAPKPEAKKEEPAPAPKPQFKQRTRQQQAEPAPAPAPAPAAPAPAPTPDPAKPQEPELSDDLREQHRLLKFAEKADGTKYKGLASKLEAYAKLREGKIKTEMEADPDLSREDVLESPEFERWEKGMEKSGQKPVLPRHEAGKLRESMIIDDATRAARDEVEKKYIEPLRNQLNEIKTRPVVQQKMAAAQANIWQSAISDEQNGGVLKEIDDAISAAKKAGKSDADINEMLATDFQMENSAAMSTLREGWARVKAFLDISHGLTRVNPNDPVHADVAQMIAKYSNNIATNRAASEWLRKANGAPAGTTYMRSSEYYKLPEAQRSAYFTLTNDNVVALMNAEYASKTALATKTARATRDKIVEAELRRHGLTVKDIADRKKQKTNDNHNADAQRVVDSTKPKPPKVNASPSGTPSKGGDPDVDAILAQIDGIIS